MNLNSFPFFFPQFISFDLPTDSLWQFFNEFHLLAVRGGRKLVPHSSALTARWRDGWSFSLHLALWANWLKYIRGFILSQNFLLFVIISSVGNLLYSMFKGRGHFKKEKTNSQTFSKALNKCRWSKATHLSGVFVRRCSLFHVLLNLLFQLLLIMWLVIRIQNNKSLYYLK